jgi:hypothetical protein
MLFVAELHMYNRQYPIPTRRDYRKMSQPRPDKTRYPSSRLQTISDFGSD